MGFPEKFRRTPKMDRDMRRIIRLTENELHKLIKESVMYLLREGAFDKYQDDLMDIELDRNLNTNNDTGFASAYAKLNDPMIKKVKGSTIRDMMSDTVGNNIQ